MKAARNYTPRLARIPEQRAPNSFCVPPRVEEDICRPYAELEARYKEET